MRLARFWSSRTVPPEKSLRALNPMTADQELTLRPIGVIHNRMRQPRRHGWELIESRIAIEPQLREALLGIEGFSHIIVLTWLHLAAAEPRELLSLPPAGDPRGSRIGVLALRVPGRPNPIGCTVAELLAVEGCDLRVRGLDAIDGTPVLDLKPYLPHYDSVPEAQLPAWASF